MAMNMCASSCLVLLALTSSFSQTRGDATQISGSSLVGVTSVSEILDQFFKKQELAGRKAPAWKGEAQAMISLVQSLKDIDPTTQAEVDKLVQNIIDTLKSDVDNTKKEQADAKSTLDLLESNLKTELGGLDSQLTKVKGFSASSKTCRENVTTQTTEFYKVCTDNDRDGGSSSSSSMSLLELGSGPCPKECGKPSTADFELTSEAKQTHTCDFEAGETAKECVAKLWGKVNLTRSNLTNKYNSWAAKKKSCEEHMARCAVCNPLWDTLERTITMCDGKSGLTVACRSSKGYLAPRIDSDSEYWDMCASAEHAALGISGFVIGTFVSFLLAWHILPMLQDAYAKYNISQTGANWLIGLKMLLNKLTCGFLFYDSLKSFNQEEVVWTSSSANTAPKPNSAKQLAVAADGSML